MSLLPIRRPCHRFAGFYVLPRRGTKDAGNMMRAPVPMQPEITPPTRIDVMPV